MVFILNELSVDSQFRDGGHFETAVLAMNLILARCAELEISKEVYYLKAGLYQTPIPNKHFCRSLELIPEKSVRIAFELLIINRLGVRDWSEPVSRIHPADVIFEEGCALVTETSVAEAAERVLVHDDSGGVLINFIESRYAGKDHIVVVRDGSKQVRVRCFDGADALESHLRDTGASGRMYSHQVGMRPMTSQTILARERARFIPTKRWSRQNTKIYEEVNTGDQWYLDNFHTGKDPHFEVFDSSGDHKGIANWKGELVPGTKIKGRRC